MQRTFGATDARSRPDQADPDLAGRRPSGSTRSSGRTGATLNTYNLDISVGIKASLGAAAAVSDPPVALRVIGNQNQSLNCDPGYTNLWDELAYGCRADRTRSTRDSPNCRTINRTTLWATVAAVECVAISDGQRDEPGAAQG